MNGLCGMDGVEKLWQDKCKLNKSNEGQRMDNFYFDKKT
jgi:hypothetical protein